MAHNSYRPSYGDEELRDQYKELNTRDLAVGDKLIHVRSTGGSWNSPITRTEQEVTVTKILASRLVVTNAAGHAYRVLVQNSKTYNYGNGRVSSDLEGNSTSYSRDAFLLYTPEDPFLIRARITNAEHNLKHGARMTARRAAETFYQTTTIENAEAAIVALQAYILANKED